jgi:hypothetical protein
MTEWALLAPGPSAPGLVSKISSDVRLCVINNAFELVPKADYLVASDVGWWRKHPAAMEFPAKRFCNFPDYHDVEYLRIPSGMNSGVLGLELIARTGGTVIKLYGVDMHGSHFFGPYSNKLKNTSDERREVFHKQYAEWAKLHPKIQVINCTPGSALKCFPFEEIENVDRR